MSSAEPRDTPSFDETALANVIALGDAIARTATIARLLIESGREVDLTGMDRGVGLLCAKALDLPPEFGRTLTTRLAGLRDELDLLTLALRNLEGTR